MYATNQLDYIKILFPILNLQYSINRAILNEEDLYRTRSPIKACYIYPSLSNQHYAKREGNIEVEYLTYVIYHRQVRVMIGHSVKFCILDD